MYLEKKLALTEDLMRLLQNLPWAKHAAAREYLRQVLGRGEGPKALVIRVRRFLCRGCSTTISVLPDALLPRRWYAGGVI